MPRLEELMTLQSISRMTQPKRKRHLSFPTFITGLEVPFGRVYRSQNTSQTHPCDDDAEMLKCLLDFSETKLGNYIFRIHLLSF
jgi:hypothetical protein